MRPTVKSRDQVVYARAHGHRQRLDAAVRRVIEIQLMRVAFGLDADGGLDHIFQRRFRDTAVHPFEAELLGWNIPDFLVIGD